MHQEMPLIAFFDIEVSETDGRILDIGCVLSDGMTFHKNQPNDFERFVKNSAFICGHNIFDHDLKILQRHFGNPQWGLDTAIDTLPLSPLLFPKNPYHNLLKDDKLQTDERNNPVNDSLKAKNLLLDEVAAFENLDDDFKLILFALLSGEKRFVNFFRFLEYSVLDLGELEYKIMVRFGRLICKNSPLYLFINQNRVALAYALALLNCNDRYSITPPWVLRNFPALERMLILMRNSPCDENCEYCRTALDPVSSLRKYFGYPGFRSYDGKALQEQAVNAAILGKSILTIFPTGGGKSITFQVPALMSGDNAKALTLVISPLQSLMKDQVDNLEKKGITEAVTINGLLDPIERSKSIERIENGLASILYISPESLRSVTIERLLLKRTIARIVIDEAHCFSSWGQDFRVDYLYIGKFIKDLQHKKNLDFPIPVSCFTATAKQKVIEDIKSYFKEQLDLTFEVFRASSSRPNLHYRVSLNENDEQKYNELRQIIENRECPTIVYVSRTKKCYKLAARLTEDGFPAKPYHGKMGISEKSENQEEFMAGNVRIMVATSAFGMGVDKSDVGLVVHYDISDSLENYVQEAGRAGRDENMNADCFVLFSEEDLDGHFSLLNQTKIDIKEINQVWKAIKDLTRTRDKASNSALEIARKAGWDEGISEIETRVKTAIAALEDAGYLARGQNMPRVFANSIKSKNAQEAVNKINLSDRFSDKEKINATRVIKKLFSSKSKRLSTEEDAESRIDYISDQLGIEREDVIRCVELMKEEQILAQSKDLTAFIRNAESLNKSYNMAEGFLKQEEILLALLKDGESDYSLKELLSRLVEQGTNDASIDKIKRIFNFWSIKNWVKMRSLEFLRNHVRLTPLIEKSVFLDRFEKRRVMAKVITEYLYNRAIEIGPGGGNQDDILVEFSVEELKDAIAVELGMFSFRPSIDDVEDTLFFLSRIEAIKIEGGFMVVYNKITIERLEKDNKIKYKNADYEKLKQYYSQKVQQIHIVGEYAKKMIRNYDEALRFVDDYFQLSNNVFISKYFPGNRQVEIARTLTPERFKKLFGSLSPLQLNIINDHADQFIVVAAGPGSGKTRLLVHKLASLLLAEDVKHEQLLMLTFSRSAATEFKKRLLDLIGKPANFVEIKTFHSYCFDLLGRVGSVVEAEDVISLARERIRSGEIETFRITKAVLVVDEAQDISADEYALIEMLMERNEDMRVILVGDDDQNIYGFRGADSGNMLRMIDECGAVKYEMVENYRSRKAIVSFANKWVSTIKNRQKTEACVARSLENGSVCITQYLSNNIFVPISSAIESGGLEGSICVLTRTNEDAILLCGLMSKRGINVKLIQSNDGFRLNNMLELRVFTDLISRNERLPQIEDEVWTTSRKQLNEMIGASDKMGLVNLIIDTFESTNTVKKYKGDWKNFLIESKIEDFLTIESGVVYVSTIHKAKGREFDNVFLLLREFSIENDEQKRQFYVAITRAKKLLSIHYNGSYLFPLSDDGVEYSVDSNRYTEFEEVVLLLTHSDVHLGYFEFVQHRFVNLFSGSELTLMGEGLGNSRMELVLKYSQGFLEKLKDWEQKGFKSVAAKVNYIVYWRNEPTKGESKIILPQLLLRRGQK